MIAWDRKYFRFIKAVYSNIKHDSNQLWRYIYRKREPNAVANKEDIFLFSKSRSINRHSVIFGNVNNKENIQHTVPVN